MKIGLSVSVVSFSAFAAVSNISVTAEAAYLAADVAAKTIIFDGADRPLVLPQTNLVSESVTCLLYTSPSPRDVEESRMPSSA